MGPLLSSSTSSSYPSYWGAYSWPTLPVYLNLLTMSMGPHGRVTWLHWPLQLLHLIPIIRVKFVSVTSRIRRWRICGLILFYYFILVYFSYGYESSLIRRFQLTKFAIHIRTFDPAAVVCRFLVLLLLQCIQSSCSASVSVFLLLLLSLSLHILQTRAKAS